MTKAHLKHNGLQNFMTILKYSELADKDANLTFTVEKCQLHVLR